MDASRTAPHDTIAQALGQPTLCAAFQLTASANADRVALTVPGGAVTVTWREYGERARAVAAGLAAIGVGAGDTVGLLLANRPEFFIADAGVMHLGATPFSIYSTLPADQITTLVHNADARVIITERVFLHRVLDVQRACPQIECVIIVDGEGGTMTLKDLEQAGSPDFDLDVAGGAVTPSTVVTLIYTSGTTGPPKGVQHTHASLMFALNSMNHLAPVSPDGRVVSYLPMAHIAERYISHYSAMVFGYTITCCPDPTQLAAAVVQSRPTRFFGVPRIFEKIRAGLLGAIDGIEDDQQRGAVTDAIQLGVERVRAEQAGLALEQDAERRWRAADASVLSGLREKIGLDQAEWLGVAAAPTPHVVLEFFHALGLPVAELWGMSEVLLSTSNPLSRIKLGTVGVAMPGVEVSLADDGEILVRGPNVMPGYRKDPDRTAEVLDADGWLRTGDIATVDEDGYFAIIDRKKELIINSAGKNMSPANIENIVKAQSPLISQVVAIGDRRLYVTALVVLDGEAARAFAAREGLEVMTHAELAVHPRVRAEIEAAITRANEGLSRVEQIKNFRIVDSEWLPGGEELTPTMKLKRKPIELKYAAQIEALYG